MSKRAHPHQGFLHPSTYHPNDSVQNTILPSLALRSLKPSPNEVSGLIPFPLHALLDPTRQSLHFFRMAPRRPYIKYRINDLVQPHLEDQAKDLEIWGLSGWFLNKLVWRLGWMEPPRVDDMDD
jgi:hypothetical protein